MTDIVSKTSQARLPTMIGDPLYLVHNKKASRNC